MNWTWNNSTQVIFGQNSVKEYLSHFIQGHTRILCIFGQGSIDRNGSRQDLEDALRSLDCDIRWEGGISPSPEYDRLVEIVNVANEFKPDFLIAIGGGSVIDATKFIAIASKLPHGTNLWEHVCVMQNAKDECIPFGTIPTFSATGTEWNNQFNIERRSIQWKSTINSFQSTYPRFSIIDPRYSMTLPNQAIESAIIIAFANALNAYLASTSYTMLDDFLLSTMKEIIHIRSHLIQNDSSFEIRERLITASLFSNNHILTLGQKPQLSLQNIAQPISVRYRIGYSQALAMVIPFWLDNYVMVKMQKFDKLAQVAFGITEGSLEEKAYSLIDKIREFISSLHMPMNLSECEIADRKENDVKELTEIVLIQSGSGESISFEAEAFRKIVSKIMENCLI